MKPRILLAALPLAAQFAACNDPSGPGENDGESRVALSYTGGVSGSFAAEGGYVAGTIPNRETFAIASRGADGTVEIVAYSQRGGSRFDLATVTVPEASVGQVGVEVCAGETCPSVALALDVGQATGSVAAHTCHLDAGSIRVTALADTRVKGTLSGSGFCLPGGGGEPVAFQVASGTFDVEIRSR